MNKTFRTAKSRQLTKRNPVTGNAYIFALDKDISAVYNGVFSQEDEDWMMWLTSKAGNDLLVWSNMPEDVRETMDGKPSNVVKLSDLYDSKITASKISHKVGKTQAQIDAEVELNQYWAGVELTNNPPKLIEPSEKELLENKIDELECVVEELAIELNNKDLVIADLKEQILAQESTETPVEDVIVVPEDITDAPLLDVNEVIYSENMQIFKEELDKEGCTEGFIDDMKMFKVPELKELATEVNVEYEGTKDEMIPKIAEALKE